MRIVCQKCSAAYAIDDKFITPQGVRAQCPRCRNLQLVKKTDEHPSEIAEISSPAARAAVAAAAAAAASSGFPPRAPSAPAAFLFDLDARPPPPPVAAPAYNPPPVDGGGELDFGDFDLSEPPTVSGALPMDPDYSDPDPFDAQPTMSFAAPEPEVVEETTQVKCRTCGKVLKDPFDQAIGVCDDCRSEVDSGTPLPMPQALAPPLVAAAPRPVATPVLPQTVSMAPVRRSTAALDSDEDFVGRPRKTKAGLAVVGVLLLVGLGSVLAVKKPWLRKPPPLAARPAPGSAKPMERVVDAWKLRFGEGLTGSSADHLAAGEEQLAKDTAAGYLKAEEEFQKALVLDRSNDRAIAGWVLALAFGRGSSIDDELARSAEELLVSAEQRGGTGRVYSAHAHLLLARNGNMNDIKVMAELGKNTPSDRDQALALLALGQSMVAKNPQYAADSFAQALKLDSKLKRALLAQSQLLLTLGRLHEAVGNLEKRLELDPDQWESTDSLARTWIEVGELGRARKVYEAAQASDPKGFRPRLALAVLSYQHENNVEAAISQLDALVAQEGKLDVKDLVEALGHRAAAQRIAGQPEAAIASAEKAIGLKADDPHANLQRFLTALEQGNAADARAQWHFISGKLADPALEGTLEGCLVLLEGQANDAMRLFAAANQKDPRRIDALLLAGASAAKAKNEGRAWEYVLKYALKEDPRYGGPLPVMARFFVRPQDLLRQARGSFESLKVKGEDPNVPTAEALIAWYSNDFVGAEKQFSRVVAADPGNGQGLAFRALLALRRKENGNATRLAQKAVAAERQFALGHYAVGMALMATNQFELAKAPFRTAFELEPRFAATRVKLAEIEMMQKKPDEARKILQGVLLVDPLYFDAKKALYALP